ncbi:MAG: LuxR C-terminal-related transcriptional regulator [Pseudooceanicola nanhaiensis]|uniref:LuxR C-terminal-related transcriptional regulator n=1 Tax=Rhodobacterales TaxID=204455 RepID=UPI0040589100
MLDTSTPEKAALLAFRESPVAHVMLRYRRIIEVNGALERLFGYPRRDLIGRSVRRFYPSLTDFRRLGDVCESKMRETRVTHWEDDRFMQNSAGDIFWSQARGVTLTPHDPFSLMIWTFQRKDEREIRSVRLTSREREIAPLVGRGLTSREIGSILGISTRTVETHRARLMKKFGVKNTAELVSQIVVAS